MFLPDQMQDEATRLAAVTALNFTAVIPQSDLQAVVKSAALACNMPVSMINLVGSEQVWTKASVGQDGPETQQPAWPFCAKTILADAIFEIPDTTKDARFVHHTLVTGLPHIRFYAGAPLRLADGLIVGALCVAGDRPSQLTSAQRDILTHLATVAVQLLQHQKNASDAARVAAELHSLNAAVPLGIFTTDPLGRFLHVNAQWRAIIGLADHDQLDIDWSSRIHPLDQSAMFARWQECAENRVDFDMQFRLLHPDGVVKVVRVVAHPTFGPDGQATGHVGSAEDLTERLLVQRKLETKRNRLSAIIDATGAATFEWNVQTNAARVGESWARLTGHRLSDFGEVIFTKEFAELHPEDRARAIAIFEHNLAADLSLPFEIKYRKPHADGHWIWVLTRFRVTTTTPDGAPEWISAVQIDISDQKKQEAALRCSEALVAKTGEVAGVGGWNIDLLTGVLSWTDQTCRIHGIEPPYVPDIETAINFYAPTSRPLIEAAVKAAIEFGTPWDLELELIRADGSQIWVRAVGAVDFDGTIPIRVYGAFQDISARNKQEQALIAEKARVMLATKSGGIGIWDYVAKTGKTTWDDQIYRLFGVDPALQEDVQALWQRAVHPDDIARVEAGSANARLHNIRFENEFRVIWPDGSLHYIRSMADPGQDCQGDLIGVNWDVTDMRNLTAELAEQHQLMRVTMRSIADAVITTDAAGIVTWMNPVAEQMCGWTADLACGMPMAQVFNILDDVTLKPAKSPVDICLNGGTSVGLTSGTILISRNGDRFGIEDSAAPIKDDQGRVLGVVLVFHDVTAERRLSTEMTYRAKHDALTGVKNRTEFELCLKRLLQETPVDSSAHAMMFIDLDQFKLVNDACGHTAGDSVLQQAAWIFAETVRSSDLIARIGGDEFGIVLEHCSIQEATLIAQSICDKMDIYRYTHGDRRFRIGASIGLVPVDGRWADVEAMIQTADASCAIAKDSGRNRVQIWQDSAAALKIRQGEVHWASRLETALAEDRFVLYAQPLEALTASAPGIHAELLVRLVDTDGTLILPGVFMPSAERFNLATPLDRWVLKNAIRFLADLPDLWAINTIAINLSGRSIGDRAFHRHAIDVLAAAGPAICSRLSLEITETAAVANMTDASLFIQQVHALGVRVALDDFGAGAASFGYLRALRVNSLKIDGQFVKSLQTDPISDATVKCFIELARIIGIPTVAEFVDQPDILAKVKAMGVDFAQGYLIAKPQPLAEFRAIYLPAIGAVA